MAITRIQNNQITDSSAGNVYLGVNAAAKVQDYSITGGKIQNNLTYGSDFTITGNLTVQGNTTTIDTVNLTVEDPLILLAKEQTGSPTLDIGYIGKRGTSDNIAFVWDESANEFVTVFTTSENTNTVITISSYASLKSYDVAVTGNLTVTGTSDFNSPVTMGNITFDSGANIQIGNNRIQNVAEPSAGSDAATKDYVDSVSSSGFTIQDDAANTTVVSGGDTLQLLGTADQVSVLVTGNDQVTFALTSNVSVAGNVTGGNLLTGGTISSTGTVTAGNLATGGTVSATGTATAGNVATGGTVSATGNVTGGNILTAGIMSATGNITANYFIGNGSQLTGIDATQIQNGTSNVSIPVANGNVEISVGSSVDMIVINSAGGDVTGYWSVSGNVTGGNLITGGIASITGTATAGNVATGGTVSATGNVTGGNILTGGAVSATGTATAGNFDTAGNVSATGNVTGGNLVTAGVATVTGNVIGGNITTAGLVTATGNVIGGNLVTAGLATVTGNVIGGNILTAGIVSAGGNVAGNNITAADRVSAIGNVISDSALVSALVGSSGGITIQSLSAGDITLDAAGNIDADNNYINNVLYPVQDTDAATKLYVDNMVSTAISYHEAVYAATTANLATTTGGTITYNQPNGAGNGIGATITTTGAFNLIDTANVQTANTRILVKDEGNAVLNGIYVWSNATVITRSSDADTYAPATANALSVNDYFFVQEGNVNKGTAWIVDEPTGNITFGTSNIAFAQFSSSQTYTANTQAGLVLNGTVFSAKVDNDTTAFDGGGNIIVKAGANLVTPNIGAATGTSLSLTGNLVSGNVNTGGVISATGNITGNYFIGNGSQLTGVTASSVDANNLVGNTLSANVVNSSLTSVGNLTTLSVVGTTTTGNLDTAGAVSATGNVTGGNLLTGGVISATGTATVGNLATGGTISATGTATVGNLDTGGTVSATGNVTGGNLITSGIATITGTVTAGNVDTGGTVSATGNVTGGNVLTGGLVSATGNVTGGNLLTAGVLSAGGNVTSANVNTGNVSATGNITAVNYTGTSVSVTGNVTAANFIGNISGNIDAGGANTEVQFNDGDLLNGSANFTFDKATNIMSVTGTIEGTTVSATGNVIAGNVSTAGLVTATGNVTGGNLVTGGLITATGAVTAANLVLTSGTFDGPAGGIINVNGSASDTDFAVNGNTSANVFYVDAGLGTTSFGNSGAITNAIVSFNTTDSVLLPRGNTAQRPAPATVGMFRFNTTSDALEVYNSGSGWTTVEQDFTVIVADSFTGNGVQTIFTLSEDSTTAGTIVSINGVVQIPTTAYSVSGNALTFTEAPSVSDTIDARILTTSTTVASLTNASGNASVECLDAADTVQIEGNLLPSANVTYNLGSPTAMWNDAYFAGNTIYLGNLQLKQADATTFAVYTNDGVTQANIDVGSVDVSSIISGTTVIGIGAPNGNAYLAPAGSNALVAASTGVFVTGLMSATGNITGNYILGNGSQLTGIDATSIQSGTSNVRVLSSGGNVSAGIGGTGNVLVLATTGAYVTGLASVTGNVIAGNLSGTNIVGTLTTAAQTNITSVGTLTSLSVTGNVTAGNLSVGQGTVNVGNIVNTNANGVGNIGSSSLYFNTVFAKATSAQYADLAEMYEADGVIESGTVVEFGGAREVTACGTDGSKRIAGVVSTNPSYIMNAGLQGDNVVAVALTGRVPVKVTGTVRKGDMMVAAGGGRARAEANPAVGSVIGKALADFDGAEGTIEVVVGRL